MRKIVKTLLIVSLCVASNTARADTGRSWSVVELTGDATSVGSQSATVHVLNGLVQVAKLTTGRTVNVRPGQAVSSARSNGNLDLRGNATTAASPSSDQSAGGVSTDSPNNQSSDNGSTGANGNGNGSGNS